MSSSTSGASRPYKQVVRARRQQDTRVRLLEVAADVFFAGRWEGTSLETVAKRAGVTKQTLLRHFGSKDGLVAQALLHGGAEVHKQRFAAPTDDVAGAVRNLLDHYAEWGERALRLGAAEHASPLLATVARQARQLHYEWVDRAFGLWLDALPAQTRERRRAALIVLCDVHTWHLLSNDLGQSRRKIQATLTEAIDRVIMDA